MQYTSTSCQVTQMYDVYQSMKCVEASSYALVIQCYVKKNNTVYPIADEL